MKRIGELPLPQDQVNVVYVFLDTLVKLKIYGNDIKNVATWRLWSTINMLARIKQQ